MERCGRGLEVEGTKDRGRDEGLWDGLEQDPYIYFIVWPTCMDFPAVFSSRNLEVCWSLVQDVK